MAHVRACKISHQSKRQLSRAKHFNCNSLNVPEIKPIESSMHVIVTSTFDDYPIKFEQASIKTSVSSNN